MGKKSKFEGNKFQDDFFKSIPSNLYCDRYKDAPVLFKHVDNPADYFVNAGRYLLLVECKSTKDGVLPIKNIRMGQVWKMLERVIKLDTHGGFLINFRKYNKTYFVFISDFVYWYLTSRTSSLSYQWVKEHGYQVSQKKLISHWRYGIQGLLNWVREVKYDG